MRNTAGWCMILLLLCACSGKYSGSQPADTLQQYIWFSGYQWVVQASNTPSSPGPNFWKHNNVWVDDKGYLHLSITKDGNGIWSCASLKTMKAFGEGEYRFVLEGRPDTSDPNTVLGLFSYGGKDHRDEIDIELTAWGDEKNKRLHYTVYPRKKTPEHWSQEHYLGLSGGISTHMYTRKKNAIVLQSFHGDGSSASIASDSCTDRSLISKKQMPVHINYWLFKGAAPSNGQPSEIIIRRFQFTPSSR